MCYIILINQSVNTKNNLSILYWHTELVLVIFPFLKLRQMHKTAFYLFKKKNIYDWQRPLVAVMVDDLIHNIYNIIPLFFPCSKEYIFLVYSKYFSSNWNKTWSQMHYTNGTNWWRNFIKSFNCIAYLMAIKWP